MAAPGAIVVSKMLFPQTESIDTNVEVSKDKIGSNILDAIATGTTEGLKLAANVAAMLLVFIAFIAMINYGLGKIGSLTGLNEIIAEANGGGGNYTYSFDGKLFETNPSYFYSTTQDYLVTVQDANGCSTSVTQRFDYIDICVPNYFTPNGDGLNDTWAPGCTENFKDSTFYVFDRYGRELGNYRLGESWDGKYQGADLPSGDYWYLLQLNNSKDNREFVGHFTLYR